MRLGSNSRTECQTCCVPSVREPRRKCKGCWRRLCAWCRKRCPCTKLATSWIKPGAAAIEIGRHDRVTIVRRDGDNVTIDGTGWPRVQRTVHVDALMEGQPVRS